MLICLQMFEEKHLICKNFPAYQIAYMMRDSDKLNNKYHITKNLAKFILVRFFIRKGRDLNPRMNKIHLPDFESGAVPSWATFPEFKISAF